MKVYVHPSDRWAVGNYRLAWPARAVAASGAAEVVVRESGEDSGVGGFVDHRSRLQSVTAPDDADVLVFQRLCKRRMVEAIPLLRARGHAVVVDVDDDLTCIDPANPAWAGHHPRRNPDDNWNWLVQACREATLVTCSTPELARRFAPHGRVVVLENCVPAAFLEIEHVDVGGTDPLVGWAGSLHSHPRDLEPVGTGVRDAGVRFRVVGPPAGVGEALHVGQVEGTGDLQLKDWHPAVAELDVGIAPLADTKFNRAKSWLKPLEYAALGVPFVASPTPEYERFGRDPCLGLYASRPRDWAAMLRLLKDPGWRATASDAGRDAVRRLHTVEGNAWRWAEAWALAAENGP